MGRNFIKVFGGIIILKIFTDKYCEPIQICRKKNSVTLFIHREHFEIKILTEKIN